MDAPIITPLSYSFKLLEFVEFVEPEPPVDCSIELAGLRWTAKAYDVKAEIKTTTSIYTSLSITIDWQTVSIQLAIDTTLGELLDALLKDQETLMLLHVELAEGSALTDSAIALETSALVYCSQCSGVIVSGVVPTQVTTDNLPATNTLVVGAAPDGVIEFETLDGEENICYVVSEGPSKSLSLLTFPSTAEYVVLLGTDAAGASISTVAEVVAAITADPDWAGKVTAREISAGILESVGMVAMPIGLPAVSGAALTFTSHVPDASVRIIPATGVNSSIIVSTSGAETLIELASDNNNNTGEKLAKAVSNGSSLCSVTPAVASATVTPLGSTPIGSPYTLCFTVTNSEVNPDISINFFISAALFLECVGNNINITIVFGETTVSQLIELVENSPCAQTLGLSVEIMVGTSSSALLDGSTKPVIPNYVPIYRNDLIEQIYTEYGGGGATPAWSIPIPLSGSPAWVGTRTFITAPVSIIEHNLVAGDDFYLRVRASMAWDYTSTGSQYNFYRKAGIISFALPAGKSASFNCVGIVNNDRVLPEFSFYQLVAALYPKALWETGFPMNLSIPAGVVSYAEDPLNPTAVFKLVMEETTPYLKQFIPRSLVVDNVSAILRETIDAAPGIDVSISAGEDSVVALQFMAARHETDVPYSLQYFIDWVIRRLVIT